MKSLSHAPDPEVSESVSIGHHPFINRRNTEKSIIELMLLGNPYVLSPHFNEQVKTIKEKYAGRFSVVSLTHAKYQSRSLVELARRAAISMGVPETLAHTISVECAQLYDSMEDPDKRWDVACTILTRFSEAIQTATLEGYSNAIRQCCEYIHKKIYSNVSLEELGRLCHLSPHYVSDLFRKELGFGALQYAHQEKMQYARYLLEHSALSISEISTALSYPSHSNFSQRFKRTYGVTPNEYRLVCG